jgi:hypothetical protein
MSANLICKQTVTALQASHLYSAIGTSATFRRVGERGVRDAAFGASQGEMAAGADHGCSSKYSIDNSSYRLFFYPDKKD